MMALRKNVILMSPRSGRLEGRGASLQDSGWLAQITLELARRSFPVRRGVGKEGQWGNRHCRGRACCGGPPQPAPLIMKGDDAGLPGAAPSMAMPGRAVAPLPSGRGEARRIVV